MWLTKGVVKSIVQLVTSGGSAHTKVKHEVARSWLRRYPSNTFLVSEIFLGIYSYMGILLVPYLYERHYFQGFGIYYPAHTVDLTYDCLPVHWLYHGGLVA